MAAWHPGPNDFSTTHPHAVALPYRGDGVACALQATYVADAMNVPNDMMALLAAIDAVRSASDRGSIR